MRYMELHQITPHSLGITLLFFIFFFRLWCTVRAHILQGGAIIYLYVIPTLMQLKGHK